MTIDSTTREQADQCLARVVAGDVSAAFDLASAFMSHVDAKDVELNLAVIEALATMAKQRGCTEAADFLADQWPDMKAILGKRRRRAGVV